MQFSGYISELLYENDCVIVPGFGGFVGNYAPAKIHPVNHTFYPPSKNILFNPRLTGDDGLLLHSVSIGEGIPYAEAQKLTEKMVIDWMNDLREGKSIELEKVGKIWQDTDGRLLFDADESVNYLDASFGLPAFISPPVHHTPVHKRLEKKFADRMHRTEHRKSISRVLSFSSIVILLGIISWFIILGDQQVRNAQQSAILKLSRSSEEAVSAVDNAEKNIPSKPLKDLNFVNPETQPVQSKSGKTEPVNNEAIQVKPVFFVIGGAFKSRANADKFFDQLIRKGYSAREAGLNPAGLIMISYFSSDDRTEALVNLDLIRQNENPSAWLLRK